MFGWNKKQTRTSSARRAAVVRHAARVVVEHLEPRMLLSATVALGGTETLTAGAPVALANPFNQPQEGENMATIDPTNSNNVAEAVFDYDATHPTTTTTTLSVLRSANG